MEFGDVTLLVHVVKFVQKELILQWEFNFWEDICWVLET